MASSAPSRSEVWARVRDLEDVLALLAWVDDRRRVIRIQAWREGNWEAVYAEATAMQQDLQELRTLLAARWDKLFARAKGE